MKPKPFLKWAGGKRQLLSNLEPIFPENYGKYVEPFVGGGAVFFHLEPKTAFIADSNKDLINTYKVVRDDVGNLMKLLVDYPYDQNFYYSIRKTQPKSLSKIERAARFIYLNRTCFNGLYRVNKKGEFNVPFGKYKNPTICDEDKLKSASKALQGVEIHSLDYIETLDSFVEPGDFVFLDPPYYPISEHSDFKRYTKDFFYPDMHVELAQHFRRLSDNGVFAILTNSTADPVMDLYSDFTYRVVSTNRNINSKASRRKKGEDLIVLSKPLSELLSMTKIENA